MSAETKIVAAQAQTVVAGRLFPPGVFLMDFPATLKAIVTTEEDGGYSASVPALPGCFTQGGTIEELAANLRDAAEGWMEVQVDFAKIEAVGESLSSRDVQT